MDYSSTDRIPAVAGDSSAEQREAPRYISLIRAAKLISSQGEFVCVIRDVSALGIGLRMFHRFPVGDRFALELRNGETFELDKVREKDGEASFTFASPVCVDRLIAENWNFPKRQLRLNITLPLTISSLCGRAEGIAENLSQQGCRLECDSTFAIDQMVRIRSEHIPEIRAKVRWRKNNCYGLVFENTFTLREFAQLAAALQCSQLLRD